MILPNNVKVVQEPASESVEEYKNFIKQKAPSIRAAEYVNQDEIECTCCGQPAPSEAAALLNVPDKTPTSVDLSGQKGQSLWICADCYSIGVRPIHVKFGDIKWNQEGKRIEKRAERYMNHPW